MTTKRANDGKFVKPNPRGAIALPSLPPLAGSHLRRAVVDGIPDKPVVSTRKMWLRVGEPKATHLIPWVFSLD